MRLRFLYLQAMLALIVFWPQQNSQALSFRMLQAGKADNTHGIPSRYHRKPSSSHYSQYSQYVEMADGTKLAVEVYLPKSVRSGAKVATILEETRYWRVIKLHFPFGALYKRPLAFFRYAFVTHGYAWVVADARAAGASFGNRPWELCPADVSDHKSLTDWIIKQGWSNGSVGLIGHSYAGNLAEFGLLNKHPAIKAAAIISSPFDLYADILRPGGLVLQPFMHDWEDFTKEFDQNELPTNLRVYGLFIAGVKPTDDDHSLSLLRAALREHRQSSDMHLLDKIEFKDDFAFDPHLADSPSRLTSTFRQCTTTLESQFGPNFASRGVELASPSGYWQSIDSAQVPTYFVGGWVEASNANAAVKRFLNYTAPGNKLMLGPWDHNFFNISPFTRGGPSRFRLDEELLKFFDYHLLGLKTPIAEDKAVNYFTLGEEQWNQSETWPPKTTPLALYLAGGNQLTKSLPESAPPYRYRVDSTCGSGKNSRWDCLIGNPLWTPYPHRAAADRKLLTYQTSPLLANTRVTGHPSVKVFVRPDKNDCPIFTYLEDVAPHGLVRYVSEGEVLCGNRLNGQFKCAYKTVLPQRSFLRADYTPLSSEQTVAVDVELLPVSYLFKKGHCIRLAIACADRDHFAIPAFAHISNNLAIYFGKDHPSVLNLPIDEKF